MALVPISDYLNALPDDRATDIAVPMSSAVLGGIADNLNHEIGYRARRAGHWILERRHDYSLGILLESPSGKTPATYRFVYTADPRAEYLQVILTYQASPLVGGATLARLSVWATNLAGTSADGSSVTPAFEFRSDDGTLPFDRNKLYVSALGTTVYKYGVLSVNTGVGFDATPTRPTLPRCLNIGGVAISAAPAVVVWVKEQECRLLSVTVKELYREMIDQ